MANELRHSDVGTALSKSEWEAVGGHIFNSQAAGDIMYASTTSQLSRLGIGSANQVLATNSGATAPEWVTSVASATLAATITVIDSTDTSSYIAMFDSATGSLAAKTDAGLTYNAGTGMLTATGLTGPLTGVAATATALASARTINGVSFDGTGNITVTAAGSTLSDTVPVSKGGTGATSLADKAVLISQDTGTDTVGAVALTTSGQLIIGGSSGPAAATLTAGSNVTISNGDGTISIAAAAAGTPTAITVADTTDTSAYVALFDSATGDLGPKTDAGITYNAGTGMLTATGFTGPLTGNASGTAATVTGAAQSAITSLGTLTTLTVDSIIINGTNIGHTSDTDAIAISSGGVVTMNQIPVFSAGINVSGGSIAGTIATASQTNITAVGTIATGTWQGTAVASAYLDADTAHLSTTQTFTGAKTFTNTVTVGVDDDGKDVKFFGESAGAYMEWDESADQLRIMGASADATTSTGKLLLATSLTDINANDVLGKIEFSAPHEAGGTDAITVASAIEAVAQSTFAADSNATDLVFKTGHSEAATEKFRFTSQGELGVGGANYGTDGQVLTSTGAGTAPAWEDAGGGGGTVTLVADGTIATGAAVYLTSAGKAKQVKGAWDYPRSSLYPISMYYGIDHTSPPTLHYDDAQSKMVAVLRYSNYKVSPVSFNTTAGSANLTGVIDMNVVTKGSADTTGWVEGAYGVDYIEMGSDLGTCYDEDENAFVVVAQMGHYITGITGNRLRGFVCTLSGTTWSVGVRSDEAEVSSSAITVSYIGVAYDKTANKVIACGRGTDSDLYAWVGTVDGSAKTLAWGQGAEMADSTTAYAPNLVYATNIGKCVAVYMDYDNNQNLRSVNISVSGTTPTGGTPQTIKSTMCLGIRGDSNAITYDENAEKIVAYFGYNTSTSGSGDAGFNVSSSGHATLTYAVAIGTPSSTTTAWNVADMYAGHSDTMGHASAGARQPVEYFGLDADFNGNNTSMRFHPFKYDGTLATCYIPDAQKTICVFCPPDSSFANRASYGDQDPTSMYMMLGTISGTSISFTSPELIYNGSLKPGISVGYDQSQDRVLVSFYEQATDSLTIIPGAWESGVVEDFNAGHLDQYLGLATTGVSDGANVTITVPGGVNENQSSLVVGSTYYLAPTGEIHNTLGRIWKGHQITLGQAISATKILVGSEGYNKSIAEGNITGR